MERFQAVLRLKIHPGKTEEFKRVVEDSVRIARANSPGTVRYDAFLNDDETEAVVHEAFLSPTARLEHIAALGNNFAAMLGIVDMHADVLDGADRALRASAEGYNVRFYKPFLRLAA